MRIAVVKESNKRELRVSASPETVKKMISLGFDVIVQSQAGLKSGISDKDYENSGAKIIESLESTVEGADIILKVQAPVSKEIEIFPKNSLLVGMLYPKENIDQLNFYLKKKISSFSLDLIPRITRTQGMDVLSSQSNLAGYRSVIDAAAVFNRMFPMMVTAAGTIIPAKVLVLGAGVAGLQAIATAKRLGAIVSAFDVRKQVKEQVESLGAKFIEVLSKENMETSDGYAREVNKEYKLQQAKKIHEQLVQNDIVITTALIQGKPAPELITEDMVMDMKSGSIIVDLAVEAGGNCPLSQIDKVIETSNGVKIIGYGNFPSRLAKDASILYSRNVFNFLQLLVDKTKGSLNIDFTDEIIKATALTFDGKIFYNNESKSK